MKTTIAEKFDAEGKLVERVTTTETESLTIQQYPALTYPYTPQPAYAPWPNMPVITWGGSAWGDAK